jgi:hypothetical protein
MKTYGEMDVQFHAILTSTRDQLPALVVLPPVRGKYVVWWAPETVWMLRRGREFLALPGIEIRYSSF